MTQPPYTTNLDKSIRNIQSIPARIVAHKRYEF